MRNRLRGRFFDVLRRALGTDDGRAIACEAVSNLTVRCPHALLDAASLPPPYADLGTAPRADRPSDRADVVIITGRFRSGSTLLWNLFRQAGGFTAYYEPFNERRWFDPVARGSYTDGTHRNVSDYWREYDGLEFLGRFYREDWIRRHLLMDEHSWDPAMRQYVDALIDRAPGRPVLQFNRIDFRLPWFRRHYPNATYIHIFRHPRDQWCSTLRDGLGRLGRDASMADFPPFDGFYLRMWAEDLKFPFPFLDEGQIRDPYRLFYYLWKLSYLFGLTYCDHSVGFESLVADPSPEIARLFEAVGADGVDSQALTGMVVGPPLGKWRDYADDAWFRERESECEAVLANFLAPQPAPTRTGDPVAAGLGVCP